MPKEASGIFIKMKPVERQRYLYAIVLLLVVSFGLLSRKFAAHLPGVVNTYLGDALWALMVFVLMGLVLFRMKTRLIACWSLLFCYAIEISQLYHAPWINQLRNTTLGGLILGFGFLWSDMLAYAVGVSVGVLLEIAVLNYLSSFFFKFKK